MLTHIVLFKMKDRSEPGIAEAQAWLDTLADNIPSLLSIEVGRNVIPSARAYDLAIVARFDDVAGLEAYQVHPVHVPVLDYMRAAAEAIVAVDFES